MKFIIFILLFFPITTFSFNQNIKNQLEEKIFSYSSYQEQLQIVEKALYKTNNFSDKEYLISIKKKILDTHIKTILQDYEKDYKEKKNIYEKYFKILQNKDLEAGIHPSYFFKLKERIHINDIYFKGFIYVFYQIKEKIKEDKNYFGDYLIKISQQEEGYHLSFSGTRLLDRKVFEYLEENNYDYLSRKDLERLKKYLIKKQIPIDSVLVNYYFQYYTFLKNIPTQSIFLKDSFKQKLQEEKLSCEANSSSLFATYILKKEITEKHILNHIDMFGEKIKKQKGKYIWGDPFIQFVGNIKGNQTKYIEKMTGYGVYAPPISKALEKNGIKNKITTFHKDTIVKSLLENSPVLFWYILHGKDGKINTTAVNWYTQNNKKIYGYVGQHTGVIIGITFFDNGDINEVYFYEGRNEDIQIIPYKDLAYQSSFFNMMIVKN